MKARGIQRSKGETARKEREGRAIEPAPIFLVSLREFWEKRVLKTRVATCPIIPVPGNEQEPVISLLCRNVSIPI